MSIIDKNVQLDIDEARGIVKNDISQYQPSEEEKEVRQMIIQHFTLGDVTMQTPRVEFNDYSVLLRDQYDQMSFNTYQSNNGQPEEGNVIGGWRSRAIRPVVRNKCISIGAHATARMMFPKVFAHDTSSENQHDAAQVLMDLMEWTAEQSNYARTSLGATIQAEVSPACIVHTEYVEVYRDVKRKKNSDGSWVKETVLDETLSGQQNTIVPVDQLYIENFFEPDIQKQGWLLWRRVQSYSLLKEKYARRYPDKWKYVKPGVQIVYNDANQTFYDVYDTNMRPYDGEEIIYWNRGLDLMIIMVNGVMLTDYDNPNPRNDKLYPFAKTGYELINSKCFYYKSLAFKISHDADIINTLYPMIVDGTYLDVMPALINTGGEAIAQSVIIPGGVTTLADPNAKLTPVRQGSNLAAGLNTLAVLEDSLNQSSEVPLVPDKGGPPTAYQISKTEQERNTVLGMFLQMIGDYVKQLGTLWLGDIMQYLTIAEVDQITDNPELVYKTFLLHNKKQNGKSKTRKIQFDQGLSSDPVSEYDRLQRSYETLKMEGGDKSDMEIYRVNPELIRKLKYMVVISPDVLNPLSEEVERALKLEEYDRAIVNPLADQEAIFKDLLLAAYPATAKDPDKYLAKPQPTGIMEQITQMMEGGAGSSPVPGGPGAMPGMPEGPTAAAVEVSLPQLIK